MRVPISRVRVRTVSVFGRDSRQTDLLLEEFPAEQKTFCYAPSVFARIAHTSAFQGDFDANSSSGAGRDRGE
jgi:hypothetical protein